MSDDMVIPDDVMERADTAWRDRMRESGYTEDANSAITAARHAEYQVIAEWAHEVALREAEEAVLSPYKGTVNTAGMSYEDAASWEAADVAAAAIRALRSGTADTNPKGDDHG